MFTGIIETTGDLVSRKEMGTNVDFWFKSPLAPELKVDQSLAHNGICLTVTAIKGDQYAVTAIDETLKRTNLGKLQVGQKINLERCMPATGRFDGHIVQGHVDTVGECISIKNLDGSWEFTFTHPQKPEFTTVPKGSITVNGVSLTVVRSEKNLFSVHIIPYTFEHTNFGELQVGSSVNLEFDIVGKYVARLLSQ